MFKTWIAAAAIVLGGTLGSTWLLGDAPADVKAAIDKSMKAMGAFGVVRLFGARFEV